MQITIHQKTLSIGDKYGININDRPFYRASSVMLAWSMTMIVRHLDEDEPLVTIKQKFDWMRQRYSINVNGQTLDFRTFSAARSQYQCVCGDDLYEIIAHKGHKYSVIKNLEQIACWDKNLFTITKGDTYTIEADRDADVLLLVAFCLIVDCINEKSHLFLITPGRIGWGLPPFDERWRPK